VPVLRTAVEEMSWLQSHGYSDKASLKLVGDRHKLRDRQRKVLQRCAASDASCTSRRAKQIAFEGLENATLVVDGYNVLLTLEAALSGGLCLLARDGLMRDLAAMSAHYRRVRSTRRAIELLAEFFAAAGCAQIIWYLDRPVSNSGRLKRMILQTLGEPTPPWRVDLTDRTDHLLIHSPHVVATADSAVIDGCGRWFNLARAVVESQIPEVWLLDLQ
jgi:hypothetical protein